MDAPLRTVIRCVHNGEKMGSVVVVRGDPIYDMEYNITGYTKKFMQIRLGLVKGKECRAFFDSLDEWHKSMGIPTEALKKPTPPEPTLDYLESDPVFMNFCGSLVVVMTAVLACYISWH